LSTGKRRACIPTDDLRQSCGKLPEPCLPHAQRSH
jgi:hypothetical protein